MRITITRREFRHDAGTHARHCPSCAATADASVVREHVSIRLGELPLFALPATWTWRCRTCGDVRVGPKPAAAAATPFLHRFGWLVFLVLPASLVLAGVRLNDWHSHRSARAALEAMRPAHERAQALRTRQAALAAKYAGERARCYALESSRGAPRTAPAQAPADLEALRGSPVISRGSTAPAGALFGPALACEDRYPSWTPIDPHVSQTDSVAAMAALDRFEADLEKREAALAPLPPVVVLLEKDFLLGTPPKKSVLTATWIQTADGARLAVAHSDEVWRDDGVRERSELAASLSRQLDRW